MKRTYPKQWCQVHNYFIVRSIRGVELDPMLHPVVRSSFMGNMRLRAALHCSASLSWVAPSALRQAPLDTYAVRHLT